MSEEVLHQEVAQNVGSGSKSGSVSTCRKRFENVGSGSQEIDDDEKIQRIRREHSRCYIYKKTKASPAKNKD